METFTKENLILFKGNVMARQKDMVIYADSLEAVIIEDGKGIEKVIAEEMSRSSRGFVWPTVRRPFFTILTKGSF